LASLPGMVTEKFIKTDYDLLFRKIILKEFTSQMNFFFFIESIERLASKVKYLMYVY
jgi:tubulin polyglutamylase TTLL11